MDVVKSREGIAALEQAAQNASPQLKAAIMASVAVARRACDDVEAMKTAGDDLLTGAEEQFDVLERAADDAEARAVAAENRLRHVERKKKIAKRVASEQAFEAQIAKSAAQVIDAFNNVTPLLANLIAQKRWTYREDSRQSILTDTRKNGPVLVWNPTEDYVTEVPNRAHAVALVKHYVSEYVRLEKMGMGINCDLPEDKNPGRFAFGGAPAEWSPTSTTSLDDLDTLGDNGPKVVADDSEDEEN